MREVPADAARVFDDTACGLGEGPLWHPGRQCLYWFDIDGRRLHWRGETGAGSHGFERTVTAAGVVDDDALLVASDVGLLRLDLDSGRHETVREVEADDPATRSNDGRADPHGGFWFGTMGRGAEPGAGAIYRYFRGELRRLHANVTIPNSICFAADGRTAWFSDTHERRVMRQRVDERDGWPLGEPETWLDFADADRKPDGAVTDAEGTLWIAFWGEGCMDGYDVDGRHAARVRLPTANVTCPAFGGEGLDRLYCTSATLGLEEDARRAQPHAGATFEVDVGARGRPEPVVAL